MNLYKALLLFFTSVLINITYASVSISYNDVRKIQRPVSLSTPNSNNIIELNNGEDNINYEGVLKVNSNFLSYNFDLPKVTPQSFEWTSGGLFPIFNSYIKVNKKFNHYADYTDFNFRIPFHAEDIEQWKIGESVYYNAVGGLGLYLTTGINMAGLGPKVYVEGGFSVYIEKKSEKTVYVEIQKIFTKNISLLAGTWGVFAEASLLKQATSGANFTIDLSKESGIDAYERLIKSGNAFVAQENVDGVLRTGTVTSNTSTKTNKAAIVTPFIPFIELLTQRQIQVYNEHRENIWDQESQTNLILHRKDRSYRLFGIKGFFTRSFDLSTDNGAVNSGSYEILKEKNHYTTKSLKRAIRKLYQYTKQDFFKNIDTDFGQQKLKYANVKAKLTFGRHILSNFNKFMGKDSLKKSVKKLKMYFNKKGFPSLFKAIESCGGRIDLVVEGELITRHTMTKEFKYTDNCEINLMSSAL